QRRFSKRFNRAKHMNDLFFPSSANAMHIDRALLNEIKTFAAITFAKEIVLLVEMFRNDKRCDGRDIGCWQSHQKLAAAECVFDYGLPELVGFQRHTARLSVRD